MAERAAKKKKDKEDEEGEAEGGRDKSLEQLVLDRKFGKYSIVPVISYWAKELRKMELHRHLNQNEILELAMSEVLSGKVSEADLAEKVRAAEPANGAREDAEKSKKR